MGRCFKKDKRKGDRSHNSHFVWLNFREGRGERDFNSLPCVLYKAFITLLPSSQAQTPIPKQPAFFQPSPANHFTTTASTAPSSYKLYKSIATLRWFHHIPPPPLLSMACLPRPQATRFYNKSLEGWFDLYMVRLLTETKIKTVLGYGHLSLTFSCLLPTHWNEDGSS